MSIKKMIINKVVSMAMNSGKHEAARIIFQNCAKEVRTIQDVASVHIGDAVRIENYVGVVLSVDNTAITIIPAFRKKEELAWYVSYLILIPNWRRTDSSYMNSVSHDIKTDAVSYKDGIMNMAEIKKILNKKNESEKISFPAFEYCMNMGTGFYLPSIEELMILSEKNILRLLNNTLKFYHADEIIPNLGTILYWSSTDDVKGILESDGFYDKSGAYALEVSYEGVLEKKVISKGTTVSVLPFCKYELTRLNH